MDIVSELKELGIAHSPPLDIRRGAQSPPVYQGNGEFAVDFGPFTLLLTDTQVDDITVSVRLHREQAEFDVALEGGQVSIKEVGGA